MSTRARTRAGYAELIVYGVMQGAIGVMVKKASASASTIVFFRLALGAATVVAWEAGRGRTAALRLGRGRFLLVLTGAILAFHWVVFFEAFKRLDVATTILIVYLGPVMIALGAPAVLGERLERRTLFALALAVGGVALIAGPGVDRLDRAGLVLAVLAAVSFAGLVLAGKRLTRSYEPPAIVAWQLGIAALFLSPALVSASGRDIAHSTPWLLALGIGNTGIAGLLYFRGLSQLKAQHTGVLLYLEPATAVLYAWLFLSESPSGLTLAGGALILAAGLLIVLASPGTAAPASLPEPAPAGREIP